MLFSRRSQCNWFPTLPLCHCTADDYIECDELIETMPTSPSFFGRRAIRLCLCRQEVNIIPNQFTFLFAFFVFLLLNAMQLLADTDQPPTSMEWRQLCLVVDFGHWQVWNSCLAHSIPMFAQIQHFIYVLKKLGRTTNSICVVECVCASVLLLFCALHLHYRRRR